MPGSSWLLCNGGLRHELPDQQVLDHGIIASNGLIAPRVTMSCRLLRPVASRGVLPRERFSRVLGMLSSLEVKVLYPT
jgi:hypothetical protein